MLIRKGITTKRSLFGDLRSLYTYQHKLLSGIGTLLQIRLFLFYTSCAKLQRLRSFEII